MSRAFDADPQRTLHEQNRRSWNAVTPAHNSHKSDQAAFLAGGGSTLFPEECALLGDIQGLDVAHLQCNCGQDTLSLAGLGATVTGIDIADAAIDVARALSADTEIPATFHRDDVLHWLHGTEATFDVVFTTYGGIGWLCDLDAWATGIARVLRPGGRLVFLEFHPMIWSFSADGRIVEPYFHLEPIHEADGVSDYVGPGLAPSGFEAGVENFQNPEPAHCFQWTVADIVQSLADAGMRLTQMREYPYANGCQVLPGMVEQTGRRYVLPDPVPALPLMLGLVAEA